jgi:SprT protein
MIAGILATEGAALERRIREWTCVWGTPRLPQYLHVIFSSRLRSSLGRCEPARGRVRLNARLLGRPRQLLEEVLCHEAAHVAVHILYRGQRRPHGPEWRALMMAVGFEPRVRIRVDWGSNNRPPQFVYVHRCPVCQASRTGRRSVPQWRCSSCAAAGLDGTLQITKRAVART